MAIPFLRLGLLNKEACLWVVSRSVGVLEAVHAFQREFNLKPFIENGQLVILPAERWYLSRGRFSGSRTLEKMRKFIEEKIRSGFTGFRGVGDTGWLETQHWFEFQEYEQKTHQLIRSLKVTAVCAYPIQHCSMTQTQDILTSHDGVFLARL